jgi:hypothetical protein
MNMSVVFALISWLIVMAIRPSFAAEPAAVVALRPAFLEQQQITVGNGDSAFAALFYPPRQVLRGRVVMVAGSSDAIRSNSPLLNIASQLGDYGYGVWLLLRDHNDAETVANRFEQLLQQASAYSEGDANKRAAIVAPTAGVNLVLHGDAGLLYNSLAKRESVRSVVLLSARAASDFAPDRPILDCFATNDLSEAAAQFAARKARWQMQRDYQFLQLNLSPDQRFLPQQLWLSKRIVGWWRRA